MARLHPRSAGTVMIVDDAPANLALLSDALEEAGYRVLVATDGPSALEQLCCVRPDVILLDGVMPGMDGFEACRRMKLDPATRDIPIIFMTALGDLHHLLRGFDEGAIDYIVKPLRNDEVIARVGAHVTQARIARRAEQALEYNDLAAVAIDRHGRIAWLTPSARHWLRSVAVALVGAGEPDLFERLPEPLSSWARQQIEGSDKSPFSLRQRGDHFTARMGDGRIEGEHLVLLQRRSGEWDLHSVKDRLGLTFRETEVLMWIARGKTNRDVGQILGSSPRTVNKHLENAFAKLGVETRSAAVALVLDRMQQIQ